MNDRPDIDSYFMEIARVVAHRSTCLHRQIGAVIVKGKQIVSTGYNGAPAGRPHCAMYSTTLKSGCAREGIPSGQRSELCRAAHAEQNAINFAARYGIAIEGATIYTTTYPCSWCAKSIVNAGIARVVYQNYYPDPQSEEILSNVETVRYVPSEK